MQYILDVLSNKHFTENFNCGVEVLDTWLKDHALATQSRRTARTFVWHNGDHNVVAYFSLSAHTIQHEDLPNRLGRGSPSEVPAILLGKFSLDKALQGSGLGSELLHSALTVGCEATQYIGARLFVVDALNEQIAQFYKHYGFKECLNASLRLARKISDIQKELIQSRSKNYAISFSMESGLVVGE